MLLLLALEYNSSFSVVSSNLEPLRMIDHNFWVTMYSSRS